MEASKSNEELFRGLLALNAPAPTPENMMIIRASVAGAKRGAEEERPMHKRQRVLQEQDVEDTDLDDSDEEYDSQIEEKTSKLESMVEELSAQNDNLEARIRALETQQSDLKSKHSQDFNSNRRRKNLKARRRCSGRRPEASDLKLSSPEAFIQIWFLLSTIAGIGSKLKSKILNSSTSNFLRVSPVTGVRSLQQSAPATCGDSPMELRRQLLMTLAACSARTGQDMAESRLRVYAGNWLNGMSKNRTKDGT